MNLLYFQVSPFVVNSVSVCRKCPPTVLADVGALTCVRSDVVPQASPLGKFALAIWVWACIRLNSEVNVPVS